MMQPVSFDSRQKPLMSLARIKAGLDMHAIPSSNSDLFRDLFEHSFPMEPMSDIVLGDTFRDTSTGVAYARHVKSIPGRNFHFHQVRLDTESTIVLRGTKILHCSGYRRPPECALAQLRVTEEPDLACRGRRVFMAVNRFKNYFHWIVEIIPSVFGYQTDPGFNDGVLITTSVNTLTEVMQHSLMLALGSFRPMLYGVGRKQVELDELVFSSFIRPMERWSHFAGYVYEKIANQVCPRARQPFRRIYISRAKSGRTPVSNEEQVVALMARHGIETIIPDQLSFADQVTLFREACLVVGQHGAGLTNIVFSQPGTVLYEIFPSVMVPNGCYCLLAQGRGVHYWADVFPSPAATQPGLEGLVNVWWEVDLDVVDRRLTAIETVLARRNCVLAPV